MLTADVLVTSSKTIPDDVRKRVEGVDGVRASLPMSFAALSANGRTLTLAAADPAGFRNFTPITSARVDEVWKRVAGGEVAVDPSLPRRLEDPKGYLRLGSSKDAPPVHIGAYAPLVKQIDAFVNYKRAEQLGMPENNALLISTGLTPSKVVGKLKKVLGPDITLQTLALEFNVDVKQTAVLTGTSVSQAVGTFNYTPHANGTVTPDPRWVSSYIRRETMPILGPVTGNKGMLPQLRAALTEIQRDPWAGVSDPPGRVRRLLRAAVHRQRPVEGPVTALVGHGRRPQRARQPARHGRRDGPARGRDLQEVGLRLGRRLELHRPHALRDGQGRQGQLSDQLRCGAPRPGGRPPPA